MKKRSMIAVLALASMSLVSLGCKKSKSTTTTPTGGGPGPGSTSWTWSGTAPLSVDIDGVHYQATNGYATSIVGVFAITTSNGSDTGVTVSFTGTPTAGTIYNCPSPANIGFGVQASGTGGNYEALAGGQIKVIAITDSTIEGQFYGTVKDPSSSSGTTHTMANGYFKVPIH